MKKTLLVAIICAAVLIPAPAFAAGITFISPESGSTVGQQFDIVARLDSETSCEGQRQLQVEPDPDSIAQDFGTLNEPGLISGNTITYSVDLSKPLTFDNPPGETVLPKSQGEVQFEIGVPDTDCYASLVLNVESDTDTSGQTAATTATPTPTPTPTVTPNPVQAEESDGLFGNLDPVLVLLIGAVAGGGATGLAEYSWIRHRRKHKL